jgi:hypothetical protein
MKLSNLLYIDTEMNGGARKRVIKRKKKRKCAAYVKRIRDVNRVCHLLCTEYLLRLKYKVTFDIYSKCAFCLRRAHTLVTAAIIPND